MVERLWGGINTDDNLPVALMSNPALSRNADCCNWITINSKLKFPY
jgi:hypothetical protein